MDSEVKAMQAALESVPRSVLEHVVDVHCHPTDSDMGMTVQVIDQMSVRICAMATRRSDQKLVADLARAQPDKVIPCFGYHPWFSHWIALEPVASKEAHYRALFLPPTPTLKQELVDAFERLLPYLPDPIPLAQVLPELFESLEAFPNAMLGEVGIDRACRVPYSRPADSPYSESPHHDGDGPRELSPFTIPLEHQLRILEAQLGVAVELKRNVSLHSVKCQAATGELLDKMHKKYGDRWLRISVDLHSCGLSAQSFRDISKKHPNIFLSLSTVINARSPAHKELIAACAPNRLLVESDIHDVRYAAPYTWNMLRTVANVKGWSIEDVWNPGAPEAEWGAVRRLEENWKVFQQGGHKPYVRRKLRRDKAIEEWEENNEDSD